MMDWPTNDTEGQIQRRLDTTYASTRNQQIRSTDANAGNGDIRFLPLLEIRMPNQPGHYANLPVLNSAPTNRNASLTVDQWLDTTELTSFGISVRDVDETSGDLVALVPVSLVSDETGGGFAAFSSRMLYYPTQGGALADWGSSHQVRLIWMVEMITDECIDPDDDPVTCARQDTLQIIHIYDDEWELTGLSISEDRGLDVAIVYEDPVRDDDLTLDDQLWETSWNLNNTFLRGRDCPILVSTTCLNSDGARDVTIANLPGQIDAWSGGNHFLSVQRHSFPHEGYVGKIMMEITPQLLDSEFTPFEARTNPTLLFLQERTSRSVNLEDVSATFTNTADLDFHPDKAQEVVLATMSWTPYKRVGGQWQTYPLEEYLTLLEARLGQDQDFTFDTPTDEEKSGKLLWAQMYYASLNQGLAGIAEIAGKTAWVESVGALEEPDFEPSFADATFNFNGIVALAFEYQRHLTELATSSRTIYSTFTKWDKFYSMFNVSSLGLSSAKALRALQFGTHAAIGATVLIGGCRDHHCDCRAGDRGPRACGHRHNGRTRRWGNDLSCADSDGHGPDGRHGQGVRGGRRLDESGGDGEDRTILTVLWDDCCRRSRFRAFRLSGPLRCDNAGYRFRRSSE